MVLELELFRDCVGDPEGHDPPTIGNMSVKAQTVAVHLLHNDGVNRGLRKGGEPGLTVRVGSPHNKSAGRMTRGTGGSPHPPRLRRLENSKCHLMLF